MNLKSYNCDDGLMPLLTPFMPSKIPPQAILTELLNSLNTIGPERTLAALKNAQSSISIKDVHAAFIINMVCNNLGVLINDVILTSSRGEIFSYTRGFIVYYSRADFFQIPWPKLMTLLERNQSSLWRSMQMISELDRKIPSHVPYLDKRIDFDNIIKTYIKQNEL